MTLGSAWSKDARSFQRAPEAMVKAAGQELKKELEVLARGAVGGDLKMRNLRNVRIGAKVTVVRWGKGWRADVEPSTPRAAAPWRWLTDGTKAHMVPRRGRRPRLGRTKPLAMKVNGDWRTGPFRVRGVRGRDLWWRPSRTDGPKRAAVRALNEEVRRGN